MTTRGDYTKAIDHATRGKLKPRTKQDQKNLIQSLLLCAATVANTMSRNTVGFSQSHIEESAGEMVGVLNETFDLEI